jgi:hypothetical protein
VGPVVIAPHWRQFGPGRPAPRPPPPPLLIRQPTNTSVLFTPTYTQATFEIEPQPSASTCGKKWMSEQYTARVDTTTITQGRTTHSRPTTLGPRVPQSCPDGQYTVRRLKSARKQHSI